MARALGFCGVRIGGIYQSGIRVLPLILYEDRPVEAINRGRAVRQRREYRNRLAMGEGKVRQVDRNKISSQPQEAPAAFALFQGG